MFEGVGQIRFGNFRKRDRDLFSSLMGSHKCEALVVNELVSYLSSVTVCEGEEIDEEYFYILGRSVFTACPDDKRSMILAKVQSARMNNLVKMYFSAGFKGKDVSEYEEVSCNVISIRAAQKTLDPISPKPVAPQRTKRG
ncbi:MAG: hypothetical protein K9H25_19225 [Rhodospirillum sp.]|nr:hypothetical protein [Rhodospirillum sp.]MCF8491240.1 hypothetical protein [Rhodospirillum sp.]